MRPSLPPHPQLSVIAPLDRSTGRYAYFSPASERQTKLGRWIRVVADIHILPGCGRQKSLPSIGAVFAQVSVSAPDVVSDIPGKRSSHILHH